MPRPAILLMVLVLMAPIFLNVPMTSGEGVAAGPEYRSLMLPEWDERSLHEEPGGGAVLPIASTAPPPPPVEVQAAIKNIVNNVSSEYLKSYVTTLQDFGSRLYRAPGNTNASIWLHDVLIGNGRLEAEYHNFTVVRPTWGTFILNNTILTLPGLNTSSNRIYYMYAHMDSIQMDDSTQWLTNAPGADDDGSGCGAALEAARVLSKFDFQDTIKFVFLNAEEIGLNGAYAYAENMSARNEDVPAAIDYDMIGYSTGLSQYDLNLYYKDISSWEVDYLIDANNRYKTGLSIYKTHVADAGSIPSDINAFYDYGFQSVMGIEYEFTSNPNYHHLSDRVENLNMSLMTKSTKLAVAALAEWSRMLYVDVAIAPGNLTVDHPDAVTGEPVDVNVSINNYGNLNATNMEVAFYADSVLFASKRIWVQENGTNATNVSWTPTTLGNHVITVALDPSNEIDETNETNNTASVTIAVNDKPNAILSATPMTALTNETILFNGSLSWDSVGGVTEYNFTFGDGNGTGWTASPTANHSFPKDGEYTAGLEVKDAKGAISDLMSVKVKVLNRAPVATPFSNPTRALTLVPIQFTSNASDAEGPVTVRWSFGDGNESTEMDPVHDYKKQGNYDIGLRVMDEDGAKANYSLRVIIDNRPPTCTIDADLVTGKISTLFKFEANATDLDGTISTYEWDLGDGATSGSDLVEYSYERPGTYTIRLTVTDDDGAVERALVNVTIIDSPPVAVAGATFNDTTTFKAIDFSSDGSNDLEGPIKYEWDFGDGNTSSTSDPEHAYWEPGEYLATLTVTDTAGQCDTASLPPIVVRNRPPTSEFRKFGNFTENGTVYFDATNSSDPEGPVTYEWDFGDGSKGTGPVMDHVFPKADNYTVRLTVRDKDGGTDEMTSLVTVNPPPAAPYVPPVDIPDDDKNQTGTSNSNTNMLIGLNLLWIMLFFIVLAWALMRRPKEKTPQGHGPPPVQKAAPYPELEPRPTAPEPAPDEGTAPPETPPEPEASAGDTPPEPSTGEEKTGL